MPAGRPTKYNEQILEKTKAFFLRYYQAEPYIDFTGQDGKVTQLPNPDFYNPPYLELLELELDIDDETVTEWCKIHKEFSGTIKRIKALQRLRLFGKSMEKTSATGAIFQLKVNHGMVETERKMLVGKDGNSLQIEIIEDTALKDANG